MATRDVSSRDVEREKADRLPSRYRAFDRCAKTTFTPPWTLANSHSGSSRNDSRNNNISNNINIPDHPMVVTPRLRKPIWVVKQQERDIDEGRTIERHLTLFDLVCVGLGTTVGSGIFVLSGYIAHVYSGPSTFLSFTIAGLAACCSGVCYAELAGRVPTSGSIYAYAYVAIGEWAAVIAGACNSLEFVVAGGAVARSWGSKVVLWMNQQFGPTMVASFLTPGFGINIAGLFISAVTTAILAKGLSESKLATNVFTTIKMALIGVYTWAP